jgi:hypothetical protein
MEPTPPRIGIQMSASRPLEDGPLEAGPTEPEANPDVIRFVPRDMPTNHAIRFRHDPARPTHLHWPLYCDWRKSKCPPRDATDNAARTEDLTQATLELCGEAGELALIVDGGGIDLFRPGPIREALLDELGDVLFECCWALDAWGANPFREAQGTGLDRYLVADDEPNVQRMRDIVETRLTRHDRSDDANLPNLVVECASDTINLLRSYATPICGLAGSTANALKKLLYQGKRQESHTQAASICAALSDVRRIAVIALGATLEDVALANIQKLDARFPDGWKPGGGIRPPQA